MNGVTYGGAFVAGLLSFLSPCVLPVVPGYISYMSGLSLEDVKSARRSQMRLILVNSLLFVIGFSVVFVAMGATATYLGNVLLNNRFWIEKIAGVVIVVFGLHLTGILPIRFLYMERRANVSRSASFLSSFVMGLAFAFGWSPCIGPVLAGVLVVASRFETATQGVMLLSAYSLGLGLPFLAVGMAMSSFLSFFDRVKRHLNLVEKIAGVLLIILGVLIFSSRLTILSRYISTYLPFLPQG